MPRLTCRLCRLSTCPPPVADTVNNVRVSVSGRLPEAGWILELTLSGKTPPRIRYMVTGSVTAAGSGRILSMRLGSVTTAGY
jgi:hypothetical protein